MANFFRNELALILGILVAKHFSGKIYGFRPPGFGSNQVYIPEPEPPRDSGIYGTGRGGYYKDYNGDLGRPGLGDEIMSGVTVGMAGGGGTLSYGGSGLYDGLFGIRKFINNIGISQISAGGAGGWYGGGWSLLGGGGGGGSSFVLSKEGFKLLGQDIKHRIIDYYLGLLPEEVRNSLTETEAMEYVESFFGEWYDRKEVAYRNFPWLYDLNTREQSVLETRGQTIFKEFRQELDGNGAVLISTKNEIIEFDEYTNEETGEKFKAFKNLLVRFDYTGETKELEILDDGFYHIIAYGGCGCDRWRGPDERYHGGYGGCASGVFFFTKGTKLLINVGSRGYRQVYRFKNASIGLGYCTGGGSSSDVRYDNLYEESRIVVAGGGGGIYAKAGDGEDPPEEYKVIPTEPIDPERDEEGNYVEEEDKEETKLKNMKFMVNDRSIVHVLVKSYNQIEIPDFAKTSCSIYINDGIEGELHNSVKPGGGVWVYEFQFKLNTIYPPNTPTHEVLIEAIIKTNFYSILATDGILVWVTTDYNLTDTEDGLNNRLKISNHQDEFSISDFYTIEKLVKRQLTLEIEDALGIDDFYEVLMELKGILERFVYDNISITDFYSKLVKLLNYKEINISDDIAIKDLSLAYFEGLEPEEQKEIIRELLELIDIHDFYEVVKQTKTEGSSTEYSEEEIEDEIVLSLVHLEYLYSNIEDTFEINDYINIELIKEE